MEGRLAGLRVVITRPDPQASELVALLEAEGARAIRFPTIRIAPPEDDYAALDAALRALGSFDWLLLTSANAAEAVAARCEALGCGSALAGVRVAAVGAKCAEAAESHALPVSLVPEQADAESLAEALQSSVGAGQRLLFPRADIARPTLPERLRQVGAVVVDPIAYRTVAAEPSPAALAELDLGTDWLTFTSPSTVRAFTRLVGNRRAARLHAVPCVVIGPTTAAAAQQEGYQHVIEARERSMAGLVARIGQAQGRKP